MSIPRETYSQEMADLEINLHRNISMIKKLHFLSLFFLTPLFCSFSHQTPEYIKISKKIFNDYCKELTLRKGLYVTGSGGAMMDDIKKVNVHFDSLASLSVDEARRLYVEVAEGFLKRYNESEVARPYLHNYPFNIENLEIMIAFEDETRKRRANGLVSLMYIGRNNELAYRSYDHEKQQLYSLHKEFYSQAVDLVKKESLCAGSTN